MYYLLILISALMFSSRFLCSKIYQQMAGSDTIASIASTLYAAVVSMISMFITSGFTIEITIFSIWISIIYCMNSFFLTYCTFKAFRYANLSIYSLFIMLGSIVLPSAFGIIFYDESVTYNKILCYTCIIMALYTSIKKGEGSSKAYLYYWLVFLGNGLSGIISKIHQSSPLAVSTSNFLFIVALINFIVCSIIMIYYKKTNPGFDRVFAIKPISVSMIAGLISAIANYINVHTLKFVDISIHSVITTAGTLVFSPLIGLFVKEKPNIRICVGIVIAVVAVIFAVL